MNQQIKQLHLAKKRVNKCRGEIDQIQTAVRKAGGDMGLCKELAGVADGLRRVSVRIDQQVARIERKAARETTVIGVDQGCGVDCIVQAHFMRNCIRITNMNYSGHDES